MCCITHMLHQAKLIKEVVKLDRISIICLVNVNIEVTEKHELFRCCDIQNENRRRWRTVAGEEEQDEENDNRRRRRTGGGEGEQEDEK